MSHTPSSESLMDELAQEEARLKEAMKTWVISDGTAGMVSQSLALVQAMGIPFKQVQIYPSPIYRLFPQMGAVPFMPISPRRSDRKLGPPWPELVIACGKRMAGAALAIKRLNRGQTKLVHIQDPHIDPRYFDAMVIPRHDALASAGHAHIIPSLGALNRLTSDIITEEAQTLSDRLGTIATPITGVMVGGTNRRYRPRPQDYERFAADLVSYAKAQGRFLVVATSRRTSKEGARILAEALAPVPHRLWTGQDEGNPYPGLLGLATEMVVTSDSVNMMSEAAMTGLPLYSYELQPEEGRLALFHRQMQDGGYSKPFGTPFTTAPRILDQTNDIAHQVMALLGR